MYSMLFLGLVGAGGVFSGTNPAYKVRTTVLFSSMNLCVHHTTNSFSVSCDSKHFLFECFPSLTFHKAFEIIHHIKTARVKFMIVEPELLSNVLEALSSSPGIIELSNIFIFNTRGQSVPKGFRSWDWLLQHGEEDWIHFDDLETC